MLAYSESTISSTTTPSSKPAAELSTDESQPAESPNDTTMWPVTQVASNESVEASSVESSTEESFSNETTTLKYETSSVASLEGVDYKQSKPHLIPKLPFQVSNLVHFSLRQTNVPGTENCWRIKGIIWPMALANLPQTMENVNLFA